MFFRGTGHLQFCKINIQVKGDIDFFFYFFVLIRLDLLLIYQRTNGGAILQVLISLLYEFDISRSPI